MEPLPQRPQTPPDHQLPPGGNKIQRISTQTQSLVQEMKRWIDLRIELTKLEIRQEIKARQTDYALRAAMGLLAALGGFFTLITIALFLGMWLGHAAWGFLIVTVVLFGLAAVVNLVRPGLVRDAQNVTVRRDEPDEK